MKRLVALSTLLFALNASADCPSRIPTEMPAIPDGPTATAEAMLDARVAFQSYVSTIEAYLRCRDQELADSSYNELVDRAMAAADAYNRELKIYQRRDGMLARN